MTKESVPGRVNRLSIAEGDHFGMSEVLVSGEG